MTRHSRGEYNACSTSSPGNDAERRISSCGKRATGDIEYHPKVARASGHSNVLALPPLFLVCTRRAGSRAPDRALFFRAQRVVTISLPGQLALELVRLVESLAGNVARLHRGQHRAARLADVLAIAESTRRRQLVDLGKPGVG